jgi:DNA processing protein
MRASGEQARASTACAACARRAWLLSELGGPLEYSARDRGRLVELLALGDGELLMALAGRRADELRGRYADFVFDAGEPPRVEGVERICRHCGDFPRGLSGGHAPHMIEVLGGVARLVELARAPVVALLGSSRASDYGVAVARSLARGLGASGVTVVAGFGEGIAVAAHAGALDAGAGSVAVMGGGLDVACPVGRRPLHARVVGRGCAVSELPLGCQGRRWGQLAGERIVVELASVVVLVEAGETPGDLAGTRIAQALDRVVGVVPGRVTSPLSLGTNAMLAQGANVVRGADDVLELLGPLGGSRPGGTAARAGAPVSGLSAELRATLERVGAGCDTPARLLRAGGDPVEVLAALTELELLGLLIRGDGGRYLPSGPLSTGSPVVY